MWWTRYSSKQRRRTAGDSAERLPPLAKTQTTSARGSSSTSSLNNTAPNAGPSAASNGEYLESTRFPVLRSSSCENPSNNDIGSQPRDQLTPVTPPGLTNLNLQHLPAIAPNTSANGSNRSASGSLLFGCFDIGLTLHSDLDFPTSLLFYVNDTFKTFL